MSLAHAGRAEEKERLATIQETQFGQIENRLAVQAGLFFEVVILNPKDLAEMGLLNAAVGGRLGPSQHFGIDDAGEETQVAEFPARRLAQQIVHPVGRMTELQTA